MFMEQPPALPCGTKRRATTSSSPASSYWPRCGAAEHSAARRTTADAKCSRVRAAAALVILDSAGGLSGARESAREFMRAGTDGRERTASHVYCCLNVVLLHGHLM